MMFNFNVISILPLFFAVSFARYAQFEGMDPEMIRMMMAQKVNPNFQNERLST